MDAYTIQFLPHDRSIRVNAGETILRAALDAGVHINASCGGEGVCGKCRFRVVNGSLGGGITDTISKKDRENGYRLACKATVCGDAVVRVPVGSEIDVSVLKRPAVGRCTARLFQPSLEEITEGLPVKPPVEKRCLELSPPTIGDNIPDTTRLVNELRQHYDEHGLVLDYDCIRSLPEILRNADFKVTVLLLRPVWPNSKTHIIHLAHGDTTTAHYGIAVDIGTTTVQGQLLDLNSGALVADVIDNRGKFNRDLNTDRIRQTDGVWEYVLVWKEATGIDRDIVLTEIDIENLIRAKGAIYSGCLTLLHEIGMSIDMIDHIVLAGGFGSYVDLDKAMTIGLLPETDTQKVRYMGNSSLRGARFAALANSLRGDIVELAGRITNFELSETPSYMDHYVAALFLPHTNLDPFPKLKMRLEQRHTAN